MFEELQRGEIIRSLQANRQTNPIDIEFNCAAGSETRLEMQPIRSDAERIQVETSYLIQPQRKFIRKKYQKSKILKINFVYLRCVICAIVAKMQQQSLFEHHQNIDNNYHLNTVVRAPIFHAFQRS